MGKPALISLIYFFQSCVLLQIPNTSINGGIHTERKVGNRDRERNRLGSAESEHESLLTHETTPKYLRHKQSLHHCTESGKLIYFWIIIGIHIFTYEKSFSLFFNLDKISIFLLSFPLFMIFLEEVDSGTGATAAKPLHGSNNYELTEFETRGPTYRYAKINPIHSIFILFVSLNICKKKN